MTQRSTLISQNKLTVLVAYLGIIAIGIAVFLWINTQGKALEATQVNQVAPTAVAHAQINTLLHVLLTLAIVMVVARTLGAMFAFIQQPPVIGEVIGGILLGPSFLGKFAPAISAYILPPEAAPFLGIIAQLGVILYMFLVGLDLDLKVLRTSGHATLAISHASILLPFILGSSLALYLFPKLSNGLVHFTPFALFMGVSMSITAFPVLARILTDRKLNRTRMGTVALTCAAVDDATAWCLLAFVVSIVHSKVGGAFITLLCTIGYLAFMFYAMRPAIARLIPFLEKFEEISEGGIAIIFIAILVSALATEFIGIHAIFGAFVLGAITPHNSRVASELTSKLEDVVRLMFLPSFFAFTGMRTQFGLLNSVEDWQLCGLIILVATVGKFGGTFIAAKLVGLNVRDSAALGVLMNTRGLVELIVLNLGLDLKIISPRLFALLVIMALVTTFMTTPLFHFITRKHPWTD